MSSVSRSLSPNTFGALLCVAVLVSSESRANDSPSFTRDVAPILVRKCLGCHNDQKAEAGLNIKTFALLRAGGKSLGAGILEPGDPGASSLVEVIRPDASPRMPFKLPPLSDAQIAVIEQWVAAGARFDGPSETETTLASLVDPLQALPQLSAAASVRPRISGVAYSPDGTHLAAAVGREVRIFDVASGSPDGPALVHAHPITWLQYLPDGQSLITAGGRPSMFGQITRWSLSDRQKRFEVKGHADTILRGSLAPDGRMLATASYDRLVKLWDLNDGKEIRTLKEHTDVVYGVAFSPDGSHVASVGGDRTLKVWDVASGRRLASLSDATAELYAVVYAPDGAGVLAGGVDRTLRAWTLSAESGALARSAFAHDGPILALVFSPDGRTLFSTSEDRTIKRWDAATLAPLGTLPKQADWPLAFAISPDGKSAALGRYDGALVLANAENGETTRTLLDPETLAHADTNPPAGEATKPDETQAKPELVRNASLAPPSPRSGVRGSTVKIQLSGNGVGLARSIHFDDPGISARLLPNEKPNPNAIQAELMIGDAARAGFHAFRVRTPLGTPAAQVFLVSAEPEIALAESGEAPLVPLPSTLTGAIENAGDTDDARIDWKSGQTLTIALAARSLGSALNPLLQLRDETGMIVAQAGRSEDGSEPSLSYASPRDCTLTLRIADVDQAGSGNHLYRVTVGTYARLDALFPTGVPAGTTTEVELTGVNLGNSRQSVTPPPGMTPGTVLGVPVERSLPGASDPRPSVVVSEGAQAREAEPNEEPATANALSAPGGFSGRIERGGDVDTVRFNARAGERWVVEVFARRIGTPLDPVIEILDAAGNRIPRAVVRPVGETVVAFRDHPSTGRNIRLLYPWTGFGVGDDILIGRELTRLHELPRGPDDDAVFWGLGNPRNNSGERVAFLETTPEHHPEGQAIYKVEIHPPGAVFPPGGVAPFTLGYRNDDGGPPVGKDARLTFDAPSDGTYLVRIEDVRGLGGPEYGYHVLVRPQRPAFTLSLATETPNIPRGGGVVVPINVTRLDGFTDAVDIRAENLPAGIKVTPARIEADQYTADLFFEADPDAPAFPEARWSLIGEGLSPATGETLQHALEPGGPAAGAITVIENPNLRVVRQPDSVRIRPGEEVTMTIAIERGDAFAGRVPIDVRNLPFGVRVLHIGLNGVLITEKQTERTITLFAEPWVKPQERPFYAVARAEAAGTEHAARPIRLEVVAPQTNATAPASGD